MSHSYVFTPFAVGSIPSSIGQLTKLIYLDFYGNILMTGWLLWLDVLDY